MHRTIMAELLLEHIDIEPYLKSGKIETVSVGGKSGFEVRPLDFNWVKSINSQCIKSSVDFHFHQTGASLIKDGRTNNIPRKLQHSQAEKTMAILKEMS